MKEWVREVRGVGLALTLACSLLACNQSPSPSGRPESVRRGMVRGKVTYKGEPLPGGFVHFHNEMGHVGVGMIQLDGSGTYQVSVPTGPVQVIVKGDPGPER